MPTVFGYTRKLCLLYCLAFSIGLLLFFIQKVTKFNENHEIHHGLSKSNHNIHGHAEAKNVVNVALVSCGGRSSEALTLIKSALLFRDKTATLNFIVFTENSTLDVFQEKLTDWQEILNQEFQFKISTIQFPEKNRKAWKTLFKPCAAQRLFLPTILKDVDSVLYMDTDTLFLSPPAETWRFLNNFNSSQLSALVEEHADKNINWYNRFARHPFYGEMGLNSGVMLMNLTRMRAFQWEKKILPIYDKYKNKITYGDQDLINILFFYFPDKIYIMPNGYNYRPDFCMYSPIGNITDGIKVLHGNRGYFHLNKQLLFKTIYETIEYVNLRDYSIDNFVKTMNAVLNEPYVKQTNCGQVSDKVLLAVNHFFSDNKEQ